MAHRYTFEKIHKGFLTESGNEIKIHTQRNPISEGHFHNFYEIELVIEGTVDEIINGNKISSSKGDMFLISPESLHSLENDKDLSLVSIAIDENFTNIELLSRVSVMDNDILLHRKLSETDYDFVLCLYRYMRRVIKSGDTNDSVIVKNCVNVIISLLLENVETGVNLENNLSAVRDAMAYIREKYSENPTLAEVAEHVNISKNYFSVLFKENAGVSFKRFLNDVKLNNAVRLLKQSDIPIIEICHSCGYDSLSTFYRKFKEKFSVSPQIYRNNYGNKEITSVQLDK